MCPIHADCRKSIGLLSRFHGSATRLPAARSYSLCATRSTVSKELMHSQACVFIFLRAIVVDARSWNSAILRSSHPFLCRALSCMRYVRSPLLSNPRLTSSLHTIEERRNISCAHASAIRHHRKVHRRRRRQSAKRLRRFTADTTTRMRRSICRKLCSAARSR